MDCYPKERSRRRKRHIAFLGSAHRRKKKSGGGKEIRTDTVTKKRRQSCILAPLNSNQKEKIPTDAFLKKGRAKAMAVVDGQGK